MSRSDGDDAWRAHLRLSGCGCAAAEQSLSVGHGEEADNVGRSLGTTGRVCGAVGLVWRLCRHIGPKRGMAEVGLTARLATRLERCGW